MALSDEISLKVNNVTLLAQFSITIYYFEKLPDPYLYSSILELTFFLLPH